MTSLNMYSPLPPLIDALQTTIRNKDPLYYPSVLSIISAHLVFVQKTKEKLNCTEPNQTKNIEKIGRNGC